MQAGCLFSTIWSQVETGQPNRTIQKACFLWVLRPGAARLRPLSLPPAPLRHTRRRPLRQPAAGTLPAGAGRRSRSSLRPEAHADDDCVRPIARGRGSRLQPMGKPRRTARPTSASSHRTQLLLETHPLGESQPQAPGGGTSARARTHACFPVLSGSHTAVFPGAPSWSPRCTRLPVLDYRVLVAFEPVGIRQNSRKKKKSS